MLDSGKILYLFSYSEDAYLSKLKSFCDGFCDQEVPDLLGVGWEVFDLLGVE